MYGDYRAGQTAHALSAHIPQGGFPPEREGRGSRFGRTAALGLTDHVWSIGELIDAALTAFHQSPRRTYRIDGGSSG